MDVVKVFYGCYFCYFVIDFIYVWGVVCYVVVWGVLDGVCSYFYGYWVDIGDYDF